MILLIAAANVGLANTVQTLIDRGADVNAKTSDGRTALVFAQQNGQDKVVAILKSHGAQ